MRRFFGEAKNDKIVVAGEEFNHLKNVLRLSVGAKILVSLNDEFEYICEIDKFEKGKAVCSIVGKNLCLGNPKKNIVLFQAVTKGPKFELIVQKATEIGISKIVPFETTNTVGKISETKSERLNLVIMNACKQCERTIMPVVEQVVDLDEVVSQIKNFDKVLFANERVDQGEPFENLDELQNIAIIVGAEGGFTQAEKETLVGGGATSISLGKRIYRCETASIAMMSLVSILSGN